jgi:hypothetical protein
MNPVRIDAGFRASACVRTACLPRRIGMSGSSAMSTDSTVGRSPTSLAADDAKRQARPFSYDRGATWNAGQTLRGGIL